MGLVDEGLGLLAHLDKRASHMVGRTAVNVVVSLQKASDSLQLCVEGLGVKGVAKQGRHLAGNKHVPHVDALFALGKHELKELHFDGPQSTCRAIENGLFVPGSRLIRDGSADHGNFLVPHGKNLEGHTNNLSGFAEGQIALPLLQAAGGGWSMALQEGEGKRFCRSN
jgi:hypothetical protein